MKRSILVYAVLALSSPAEGEDRRGPPSAARSGNSYANPSAVIAAELAFAQAAQARGQWSAFAAFAAPDAVMFVPHMVWAQQWLKGRGNPVAADRWQPHAVWSSCDGSLVVSHGAWQGGARTGWFTAVWQRQADGAYKWIARDERASAEVTQAPEMLAARIADCPEGARRGEHDGGRKAPRAKPVKPADLPPLDPARRGGSAADGSLHWAIETLPDRSRKVTVTWQKDGREQTALAETGAGTAGQD